LSAFDFAGYYGLMTVTGHDDELLRRYADEKSEDAFAELVRRHLDLVYSAALRQVNGDAHLAQDVAQMVFTELSRKAASLSHRPVLTGWLYTCAHFCAAKAVRTERRRHSREQEAQAMQELLDNHGPEPDWEKVRPVLDQVMVELSEPDREAILMRYFEKRPLGEIGQRLGLSEDAARKRVERGLEKLRAVLARRGLTTSASLAIAISANAVHAAPAGLAAVVTAGAVASSAATPRATAQDTTSHELIQKDAWAFLGYADPESAFQSTVWAMNKGDAKTFLNSLSPEGENFKHVQDRSESEVAAENKRELEKVTAYKIVDKETVSDNEVILTVFAQGESHLTKFRLQRIGTEWKLAGPIKGN
jgi:RNA polymerase sigma factor (sigma-70 family)